MQRSWPVLVALFLSLAIFLGLDDLLFYVWFERAMHLPVNLSGKIAVGSLITLMNLGIAALAVKAWQEKPQTGAEGMLGKSGEVVRIAAPHYSVRVHGELWRARSKDALQVGDQIIVHQITGLTLEVGSIHNTKAHGGMT